MPQGPDGNTIIIVKKVSGHGGAHGGAWKVAYADFVTSMMCLFLVLWLVNSASVVTRERIASYFKQPGIFDKGSGTPLEIGQAGILKESFSPPGHGNSQVLPDNTIYNIDSDGGLKTEGIDGGEIDQAVAEYLAKKKEEQKRQFSDVARKIKEVVESGNGAGQALSSLGQFSITLDETGLHIEIMDTAAASMFALGSADVLPDAHEPVKKIASLLKTLSNPIDIEGHTDSRPFKTSRKDRYDNWNLSADRANAARHLLLDVGIDDKQIASVVGFADRRLKHREDPFHPANRRITISVRYSPEAATIFKDKVTPTKLKETKKEKETAEPRPTEAVSSQSSSQAEPITVLPAVKAEEPKAQDVNSSSSSGVLEAEGFKDGKENKEIGSTVPFSTSGSGDAVKKQNAASQVNVSAAAGSTSSASNSSSQPAKNSVVYSGGRGSPGASQSWKDKDLIFKGKNPFEK